MSTPPRVLTDALKAYLPQDRVAMLVAGEPLAEARLGTVLFADISGFTPLTEGLITSLGSRRGVEALPPILNRVYDALIAEVERYGGSVVGFSGDAITCWFDGDDGRSGVACALRLQQAMTAFANLSIEETAPVSLKLKVALSVGTVKRFLVGNPEQQLLDVLAGDTLRRVAAAESAAKRGEVLLDEASASSLEAHLVAELRKTEEGNFYVVQALTSEPPPSPPAPLEPRELNPEMLRPYLHRTVFERLVNAQGEFLTELRPAVALFLRFGGIDYDADPEGGAKLDLYIRWVQGVLEEYGGSLLQLTLGDKGAYLYAAFGAPSSHEDDAARAVHAALVLKSPPPPLAFIAPVYIGLTQGVMRTGAYGGSTRRTYGVLGDEVNLSARLMMKAQAGQIVASARIEAATRGRFRWQSLGETTVKGKSSTIAIYEPIRVRRSLKLQEPHYRLPMIGRQKELRLIEEKLELTRQGQGHTVGIEAEAGMGKSRLLAQVLTQAQAQGLRVTAGACEAHGLNTPYLVWRNPLRDLLGLDPEASLEAQAQDLELSITRLEPQSLPRLPLLAEALGLTLPATALTASLDAKLRKESAESLIIDLLKRTLGEPQVLMLEDLHWLDSLSRSLLERFLRVVPKLPVLLLLAYRPTDEGSALKLSAFPQASELSLSELNSDEAERFVAAKLELWSETLPPDLSTRLVERAQGNPFYLEELLNYFREQGASLSGELALPDSLHSLILSRIDRLSEHQKVLLKVASVIGRAFKVAQLKGTYPDLPTVEGDLETLQRLDLTPLETPEPELTYLFKHMITRDVAYESLPYETRARLHEAYAGYLERLSSDDTFLDLLAHHYSLSGNGPKKRHYLIRAGDKAAARYANEAALGYYGAALDLLPPAEQIDLLLKRGEVLDLVGRRQEAEASYQRALTEAEALGNGDRFLYATLNLGRFFYFQGDYEEGSRYAERAERQALERGDQEHLAQSLRLKGEIAANRGDLAEAQAFFMQALALFQARDDKMRSAYVFTSLAQIFVARGDYTSARSYHEASLEIARDSGDKMFLGASLCSFANMFYFMGQSEQAEVLYQESLSLARDLGDKEMVATLLHNLGVGYNQRLQYPQALAHYQESLDLSREIGDRGGTAHALFSLGDLAADRGQHELAHDLLTEGLTLFRALGEKEFIAYSLDGLARVAVHQHHPAEARALLDDSLRLFWELGIHSRIPYLFTTYASLAVHAAEQRPSRAVTLLAAAHSELSASSVTPSLAFGQRYDQPLDRARATLDESAFSEARRRGEGLTLEEAVRYALEEESLSPL